MDDELEIEKPKMPAIRVIENGKSVDTSAIDDYDSFMNFLMLSSIASQAVRVRRYFDDRTPEGLTENFALNITPTVQEVLCSRPSQTLFVVNDGLGQIFVTINARGRTPTPLLINETMFIDFEIHKLRCFYVWSAPGTVATARAMVRW
jgi:hypothetical protein